MEASKVSGDATLVHPWKDRGSSTTVGSLVGRVPILSLLGWFRVGLKSDFGCVLTFAEPWETSMAGAF